MSTIVAKLFRHLSIDHLKSYFAFRTIDAAPIDWQARDSVVKQLAISLINAMPDAERTIVFTDAEAIAELADDPGQLAMLDATRHSDDILRAFNSIDSAEGRALWLFINDSGAFKRAGWVRRCDRSRQGRDWSGFIAPTDGKLDLSEEGQAALASACTDTYRERDGFRGAVAFERFDRLVSWRDEGGAGSITQITIYTEDRPQSQMAFERDGLQRQIRRPASEVHITYCAADRSIDVVARGGRSMRKTIATLFAHHLLGVEADLDAVAIREIDLSGLADRSVLTRNVHGAIAEMNIKHARFQPFDDELPAITYSRRKHSIYDSFERGRLERPGYEIDRVELAFTFLPEAGSRRGKRATVTLTTPNGCSVKDQGQLHRPAIERFLERAGIYRAIAEDDDEQTDAAA